MTVTDNGHGILDPEALLTYGLSAWRNKTAERPTGMGLFSLANDIVVIKTRDGTRAAGKPWSTTLTPQHFRGQAQATRTDCPDAPRPHGTSVSITADGVKTWALEELGRHFPIPVHVCGKSVEQTPLLDQADEILEWNGLRIGLFAGRRNIETRSTLCWHGAMSHLTVRTTRGSGHVKVDVIDCPDLRISRPGLHLMIDDPLSRELTALVEARLKDIQTNSDAGI